MNKIIVHPNEVTCTECGETFPAEWSGCPRCSTDDDTRYHHPQTGHQSYKPTKTVPTTQYLREGEYVYA
jgi:hypothetical protein